jgi:succinate dehydrogenase / fumarate reductase cytochrome b subunit
MGQKRTRPLSLGIFHMRLPVSGWVSIFHRVTGVLLVLALPAVLYLLQQSLASADRFDHLASWFAGPVGRVVSLLLAWLFIQHLLSGIRHLLLDLDIGIEREAARASAVVVFVMGVVLTLLLAFAWR